MRCRKQDCFSCPYPDCINDYVPPERKANPEIVRKAVQRKSAMRKERVSSGLCTECGKYPPREGYKMCHYCQAKFRKYKNDENHKKGIKPRVLLDGISLCQKCGKHPPEPNYKLCKRCLENALKHLSLTPTHNGKKIQSGFTIGHERFWHD